jgi:hypothetical protein
MLMTALFMLRVGVMMSSFLSLASFYCVGVCWRMLKNADVF